MAAPVRLSEQDAAILRRGHPWLFHGARYDSLRRARAGEVVDCVAPDGRFVARGLVDPQKPIAVRVLTRDPEAPIDAAWLQARLAAAHALRQRVLDPAATTAWRWVNGEGDWLPGLVVDWYDGHAALQVYTAAWHPWLDAIVAGLRASAPVRGVVARDRVRRAPLADADGARGHAKGALRVLWGEAPPEDLVVQEHGVRVLASLERGQKTGLYLDQRDNRRAVAAQARGADLLNCFSYTGGFGLHAALAGARQTTNVDMARPAQAAARRNYELNGLDPAAHRFVAEDVFEWLGREARRGHRYDVVITDPPSFATSRAQVWSAAQGYRRLAAAACAVTRPGGLLVAASCTAQFGFEDFRRALQDGAGDAGVALRVLERRGLPADHPVPVAFPEGHYLKLLVCLRD
jgi:23S rRNA (cytosine1962-C5)-methyltransferase